MSITEGTLLTRFARTVENPESTPIDGTFPSPIPNSSDMESRRPDETAPAMTTNNPVKNRSMDQSTCLITYPPALMLSVRTMINDTAPAARAI